jgi:hypothetical protein
VGLEVTVRPGGLLDPADGEAFAALSRGGGMRFLTPMLVAAAGRRPE